MCKKGGDTGDKEASDLTTENADEEHMFVSVSYRSEIYFEFNHIHS